jgi:hypothetical protein
LIDRMSHQLRACMMLLIYPGRWYAIVESYRRRTLQRVHTHTHTHTPVSIDQSGSEGAAAATHKKGGVEDPGLFFSFSRLSFQFQPFPWYKLYVLLCKPSMHAVC